MSWLGAISLLISATSVGTSTSDFCKNPTLGPGGSPITYCEAQALKVVTTPYFAMSVPEGSAYAIHEDGRSGEMQPNLRLSMCMLSVRALDQDTLNQHLSSDYGQCSYAAAGAERICKNEIDGDTIMERIVIGQDHSIRVLLVERWSGPPVETYRQAVLAVTLIEH